MDLASPSGVVYGFRFIPLVGMRGETLFLYVVCQLFYPAPNTFRTRHIFLLAIS